MIEAARLVADLRAGFESGITRSLEWRRTQLIAMQDMLADHQQDLVDAICADIGKPPAEAKAFEIGAVNSEIEHTLRNLRQWTAPRRVGVPLRLAPATAHVVPQPLGVVLILAPWNYPLQLILSPMIGALAAGNAVVVKPSEIAPETSARLAELIPQYFDPRVVAVVEGGVAETTELLGVRFDHIMFTGNTTVGKVVMRAAAEHLTPVTLELGGKSPAYVDAGVDLAASARRIAWAKFVNAGQTCVCPDYVLVHQDSYREFLAQLRSEIGHSFGANPQDSPDYGRIVNRRQLDRIAGLIGFGRVYLGGRVDPQACYIEPTVLTDVAPDAPVLSEEIFGPVLPVVPVRDAQEAIAFVNDRPKPLALYLFTRNDEVRRAFTEQTSSGALGLDVALMHVAVTDLPFGGVGDSGMGRYHGRYSIDAFSHLRAVLGKPLVPDTLQGVYPPHGRVRHALMRLMSGMPKTPRRG